MNAVSAIALSGLSAARTDLRDRAHNLANLGTAGYRRSRTERSTLADGGVHLTTTRTPTPGHHLAGDLVGSWQARNAFMAHLAVFRSADAMAGTLLDLRG
jgi:flagellar hook protein FlgE